jgi:hypothetical protein
VARLVLAADAGGRAQDASRRGGRPFLPAPAAEGSTRAAGFRLSDEWARNEARGSGLGKDFGLVILTADTMCPTGFLRPKPLLEIFSHRICR